MVLETGDQAVTISGEGEISFNISGDFLYISVKDFGKGIKNEDLPKLTDPFYRGDRENNIKGFGIGLTIVKKVIEAHNGELNIESEYGKGSLFTLKIQHERGAK